MELIKEDNKNELPKSQVEAFNGGEVFLESSIAELEKFKV
jgi:hypothetical protein